MSQLIPALPGLVAIGLGTGLLALFGRDPKADQHDISDYKEPAPSVRTFCVYCGNEQGHQSWCPRFDEDVQIAEQMLPAGVEVLPPWDDDILPPAPPGTNAGGTPIHTALIAEQVIAEQLRKWGPTPAERAHRILRELGDKAQMEATR